MIQNHLRIVIEVIERPRPDKVDNSNASHQLRDREPVLVCRSGRLQEAASVRIFEERLGCLYPGQFRDIQSVALLKNVDDYERDLTFCDPRERYVELLVERLARVRTLIAGGISVRCFDSLPPLPLPRQSWRDGWTPVRIEADSADVVGQD